MNQNKMYRCIKLMQSLQENAMHIHTIEKYLEVSNRTVYRYLRLYEKLGFKIVRENHKVKLEKDNEQTNINF